MDWSRILAYVAGTVDQVLSPERAEAKRIFCSRHTTGNGSISTASVISTGCRPSTIASTVSGASSVSRRRRSR